MVISYAVIDRAKYGEKDAFILIFSTYSQKVFNTAYFILKDKQYAEDVVQETFLQVYLKINKLKAVGAFEIWLYKIAVNHCMTLLKKLKRKETVELDEKTYRIEDDTSDAPEDIVVQMEIEDKLMKLIYSLDYKHRIVLTLFYFNNMNIKDIAIILKCSEGTVKSRLSRGKKYLKAMLDREYASQSKNDKGGAIYEY